MTPENVTLLINALASAPTQGILWFMVFWGVRSAMTLAKERIAWLQARLDKYMDRDTEIVSSIAKSNIETAGKYSSVPKVT